MVWILPFRQISGKGQFLTPAHAGYRRKKSTAIARKCLISYSRIRWWGVSDSNTRPTD
ncbi:hypothetical protein BCEP27_110073 [Burkholderia cepacia]